jgi:hypothetical protein
LRSASSTGPPDSPGRPKAAAAAAGTAAAGREPCGARLIYLTGARANTQVTRTHHTWQQGTPYPSSLRRASSSRCATGVLRPPSTGAIGLPRPVPPRPPNVRDGGAGPRIDAPPVAIPGPRPGLPASMAYTHPHMHMHMHTHTRMSGGQAQGEGGGAYQLFAGGEECTGRGSVVGRGRVVVRVVFAAGAPRRGLVRVPPTQACRGAPRKERRRRQWHRRRPRPDHGPHRQRCSAGGGTHCRRRRGPCKVAQGSEVGARAQYGAQHRVWVEWRQGP